MRTKGWERVRYVRYQTAAKSNKVYEETQAFRKTGLSAEQANIKHEQAIMQTNNDYTQVNP
jgi:hypothetical protein